MNIWEGERKASTDEAAAALNERIRVFFEEQATREQGITIRVDAGDQQAETDGPETHRTLRFTLPDGTLLDGFYRISNTGGTMYAVEAGVGDRSAEFSISLPEASAAAEDNYGRPVCDFLLEEIERLAGELRLRETSTDR